MAPWTRHYTAPSPVFLSSPSTVLRSLSDSMFAVRLDLTVYSDASLQRCAFYQEELDIASTWQPMWSDNIFEQEFEAAPFVLLYFSHYHIILFVDNLAVFCSLVRQACHARDPRLLLLSHVVFSSCNCTCTWVPSALNKVDHLLRLRRITLPLTNQGPQLSDPAMAALLTVRRWRGQSQTKQLAERACTPVSNGASSRWEKTERERASRRWRCCTRSI